MTKKKILFSMLLGVSLASCQKTEFDYKDVYHPFESQLASDTLRFAEIDPQKKELILQLDEPTSIIVNPGLRRFSTTEPIQVSVLNRNSIQLTSYSAAPIRNLNIYCQVNQIDSLQSEKFLLATIDSLPGFGRLNFQPEFSKQKAAYKTVNGKYISFHQPYFTVDDFTFTLESEDKHFQMLRAIKPTWDISYSNYEWDGVSITGKWLEVSAIYAREWVVIMTNLAYIVSTPEFKVALQNYKAIMGGDVIGNDGANFTTEQYENLYNQFLAYHRYVLGRTGMGGGLGGGSILGVDDWYLYVHYRSNDWMIIAHEVGHCLGYGHNSNMTYGNGTGYGFADSFIPQLHSYFRRKNQLPYGDPNLLGFGKPENAKYHNMTLNPAGLVLDNNKNKIDTYFEQNPIQE